MIIIIDSIFTAGVIIIIIILIIIIIYYYYYYCNKHRIGYEDNKQDEVVSIQDLNVKKFM